MQSNLRRAICYARATCDAARLLIASTGPRSQPKVRVAIFTVGGTVTIQCRPWKMAKMLRP